MVRPKSISRSRTPQPQPLTPQPTIPVNEPINQPSSSGVQTRPSRGKGVHVATSSYFGRHLNFTKTSNQQRYAKYCERHIIPYKCCEKIVMGALGIREEVERIFTVIGWWPYLDIFCPTFVELVRSFTLLLSLNCLRDILSILQIWFISIWWVKSSISPLFSSNWQKIDRL